MEEGIDGEVENREGEIKKFFMESYLPEDAGSLFSYTRIAPVVCVCVFVFYVRRITCSRPVS